MRPGDQMLVSEERVIRVWFGHTAIAEYQAMPEPAAAYAAAMDRRYPGLRISNDPVDDTGPELRRMPGERLWDEAPALT